jgi:hypothetical protein
MQRNLPCREPVQCYEIEEYGEERGEKKRDVENKVACGKDRRLHSSVY